MLSTFRCGLLFLAMSSAVFAEGPKSVPPKVTATLRKKEDTFQIRRSPERTVYLIKSPSGIGDAKITRSDGDWPRNIAIRLQYDDERAFGMLESCSLRTDRLEIGCALRIPDLARRQPVPVKLPFWFLNPTGDPKFQHTGGIKAAGTLDATVQLQSTGLEITLPPDCLMDSKTLTLDWIDAYRH